MRHVLAALLLLAAGAAAVILALPAPSPSDEGWTSPVLTALRTDLRSPGVGANYPCSTCHYGFLQGFDVEALREQRSPTEATYRVRLQPVSGYELAVAWAAPRREGDGLPDPVAEEVQLLVPAGGGSLRVGFDLPWPAAALVAEARPAETDRHPPLSLRLEGPDEADRQDLGSPSNKHAWVTAPLGEALEGRWEAVVLALDPADSLRPLNVTFRAIPIGYTLHVDDGSATGTRGRAAAFTWDLPAQGQPGAPERFHVGVVAYNAHPLTQWSLPAEGDRALYEGNVSASEAAEPPAPPFPAEEIEAAWQGGDRLLLHEHAFDGLLVRAYNERGERAGETLRLDLQECPPCDPPVFPPMPPGTTHVEATLTWTSRDPQAPAEPFRLGLSQRPEPDFRYPEPAERAPGRLLLRVPVQPVEWEREDQDGWLQVWPLLVFDAEGRASFNGRYDFRVEALRQA